MGGVAGEGKVDRPAEIHDRPELKISGRRHWWLEDKTVPFATLLTIIEGSCHPESYEHAFDDLIKAARKPDEEMHRFKDELRAAIADPTQIPAHALFEAAGGFASDEEFLRRLWHDLYGDEPVTAGAH